VTEIPVEQVRGIHVVSPRGELDAFTIAPLRELLAELIEEEQAVRLVIDLSAVTFLDSTALGPLVGALRRMRERDGRLGIVSPVPAARRIFELTGLDGVLDLHATREAALA
jgi:anti-sigma B factor antagonist